jgi:hypothetical protein
MKVRVRVRLTGDNRFILLIRQWLIRFAHAQSDELVRDAYAFEELEHVKH